MKSKKEYLHFQQANDHEKLLQSEVLDLRQEATKLVKERDTATAKVLYSTLRVHLQF